MVRRGLVAAILLAACHHPASPAPEAPVSNETAPSQDQVFLDAAELLAHGPTAATPRVTIDRYGEASLAFDGPREVSGDPQDGDEVMPVAEVRAGRARILHDAGDQKLLVWVDRTELVTVVAHETGVAPGPNDGFASANGVGVRLRPGTRLLTSTPAAAGRRAFSTEDDGMQVIGELDAGALGDLFVPVEEAQGDAAIGEALAIRAAPDANAAVIATTLWPQMVTEVSRTAGWALVETTGPHVIARGYVREGDVGVPLGGVWGRPAAVQDRPGDDPITVTAGACLYDGKDGALTGVEVETLPMAHTDLGDGWHQIEVNTFYGQFDVTVHDEGDGLALCKLIDL